MGAASSQNYTKKKKVLSVISLNYSGILLSPFQFFSKQNEQMTEIQTNLSNLFKMILKKYHPQFTQNKKENKFKWNLGKIDQKMQKQRYSPLYDKQAGLQNKKILTQQQFKQKWLQTFNKNIDHFKTKDPGFKYTQSEKNQALQFDTLCYKCILAHVYKINDLEFSKIGELDYKPYKQFMELMFSKSFLNEEKKLKKTFDAMERENIDIVFAQQADQSLINALKNKKQYVMFKSEAGDSIIVIKKQKFNNFYSLNKKHPLDHLPELRQQLNWNNDTVVAFVDNVILISGHLSSKKQKNPVQVYQMMQSLKKLHALYPMCHIIVGCDVNSYLPATYKKHCQQNKIYCKCGHPAKIENKDHPQQIKIKVQEKYIENLGSESKGQQKPIGNCLCLKPVGCEIFPEHSKYFTTSKQRTFLQPQINKAQDMAQVCRDHLIIFKSADMVIQSQKVCTITNGSPQQVKNLPCQQHPYDHYVVKVILKVNVVTNFGQNKEQVTC